MARILYFSRDYSTHDHRFLTALEKTGHQIYYLRLESRGHSLEDRPVPSTVKQVPWAGGNRAVHLNDGFRLALDLKKVLKKINPEASARLMKKASDWTASRFEYYQKLAALTYEK
jgi:hypothetical protein